MEEESALIKASELADAGDYSGAMILLELLFSEYPESRIVTASLANAYWNMERIDDAATYYKQAIKLSPDFEEASLGLFHCLWIQNKNDEAFEEMKRFMSISYSIDYENIINEINNG